MQNQLLETIKGRRSIRKFTGKQIAEEQLALLLEAAAWAPSGNNKQTWRFTALQNKDVLLKLNELVVSGFTHWIPKSAFPSMEGAREMVKREEFNFYYHAPTLIVFSNLPDYANAMADCAAAIENTLLLAHALDLGACWINQLRWLSEDSGVREYLAEFEIPIDHVICGAVAVGFADQTPMPPTRKAGTSRIFK
jgi:nitroreductase